MKGLISLHRAAFVFVYLGLASALSATITGQFVGIVPGVKYTAPDPAFTVIDSDEANPGADYFRHQLPAVARVLFSHSGVTNDSYDYRVRYRLVDASGTIISLKDPLTGKKVTELLSPVITLNMGPLTIDQTRDFAILADPIATLLPQERYRVECELEVDAGSGWGAFPQDARNSSLLPAFHFTNLTSGDPELNTRVAIKSTAWTRTYLIGTDPSKDTFTAEVKVLLGRYDDYDDPSTASSTTVVADFDLFEAGGAEIPLQNNGQVSARIAQANHGDNGVRPIPDLIPEHDITANLVPTVQLASRAQTYELRVTVRHLEIPKITFVDDDTDSLAAERLLHFNGTLRFGSLDTEMFSVANDPPVSSLQPTTVRSLIQLDPLGGVIPNRPDLGFGSGIVLKVDLDDAGVATVYGGGEEIVRVDGAGPVLDTLGFLDVEFGTPTLSSAGPQAASATVHFPQGLGVVKDASADAYFAENQWLFSAGISLNDDIELASPLNAVLSANARMFDESHPLIYDVSEFSVALNGEISFVASGSEHVSANAYNRLATIPAAEMEDPVAMRERLSNDGYLRFISLDSGTPVLVNASFSDGSARCSASFETDPGAFKSHFPYGAEIRWSDSDFFQINYGIVDYNRLMNPDPIQMNYGLACPNDKCSDGAAAETTLTLTPVIGEIQGSWSGGLTMAGDAGATELSWGWKGNGMGGLTDYTHRTDAFANGRFYMPGYRLLAEENPLLDLPAYSTTGDLLSAGVLLLEGYDYEWIAESIVYPETEAYRAGYGAYAGITYVVEAPMFGGASKIAGNASDYGYKLLDQASKYYARKSGISGRHVAIDATFDPFMLLYGYGFGVSQFQLTFLSSENEDSWFDGELVIPPPLDFSQRFKGLLLSCTGDIDGALSIDPGDLGPKSMRDWNSEFQPKVYEFVPEPSPPAPECYPPRTLIVGGTTQVAHVPGVLAGQLEILEDGNLGTAATGHPDYDSRLGIPATMTIDGPNGKSYRINPVTKLYFTNPYLSPDGIGQVAFAATVDVPFFEDLKAHIVTSANPNPNAAIYLCGGWEDPGPANFFNTDGFDNVHRGFPAGLTKAEYLSPDEGTNEQYLVKAEQSLFGLIPLSYPLRWSNSGRYFRSMNSELEDLVILRDVYNQVDFLGPDDAEISFGAQYEGLPQINLASIAFDVVDEQVGAAHALTQAATSAVTGALDEGIDEIGSMVGDNLDRALEDALDQIEQEVLAPLFVPIQVSFELNAPNPALTFDDWVNQPGDGLKAYLSEAFSVGGGATDTVRERLVALGNAAGDAQSLLDRVDRALVKAIFAIDSVTGELKIKDGIPQLDPVGPFSTVPGVLWKNGDDFEILQNLTAYLMADLLGPDLGPALQPLINSILADTNAELNGLIEGIEPSLDQIVIALNQVRSSLFLIRSELQENTAIFDQFNEIIEEALSSTNEIDGILGRLETAACDWITDQAISAGIDPGLPFSQHQSFFLEFDASEFAGFLRDQLRDELLASEFIRQIQFSLRHALYDVDLALRSGVDSVFEEVNRIVKDLIKESLGPIDDAINGLIGELNEFTGAGGVDGYAHIEGDSLKRLRIDAYWQMKVPDDLEFHAYVEILSYDSGDDFAASACLEPGVEALEVRIGVEDVALDWISPDLRASIGLKFSMETAPDVFPKGFSGYFLMTGALEFQSFTLSQLDATLGFSIGSSPADKEAYLGAAVRMSINSYEAAGAFFIGRTCSIEPLLLIDADVAEIIGDPPFTGGYVYGEVWIPISEVVLGIPASCFFNISAGVGAGAFYFVEGPTFGGKMLLGVSGEALCVVSIKGEVRLVGVMQGGSLRMRGKGTLTGKAGWCPFCLKFKKSATVTYQSGSWDVDL
ncbi:hypothetical protein HAHE_34030 [Haloferula helveola]|uniref:Uncharacterized protein n=1 Tax=Haloferula helveola TaxID=490095 RepID=A0ABM7RG17_9BACT|nr:hypothetical protein HAHE_34030 [Haloferula helveola]